MVIIPLRVRVSPRSQFGHVKRNCMTAPEYGSGLERVAGWNPAVVTICSGGEIGYHEGLRNLGSGFEFRLEYNNMGISY